MRGRLREGVLVAAAALMLTLTVLPGPSLSVLTATQTVVPTELYEPVITPPRAMAPAIRLGADEAPRAASPTPTPEPTAMPRATPKPATAVSLETSHSVEGTATWYAAWYIHTGDLVGAAGPLIRVGDWRGRIVQVCSGSSCVNVKLVDWCACGDRGSLPTLIDLSPAAFSSLAPLSRGVIRVEVSW